MPAQHRATPRVLDALGAGTRLTCAATCQGRGGGARAEEHVSLEAVADHDRAALVHTLGSEVRRVRLVRKEG